MNGSIPRSSGSFHAAALDLDKSCAPSGPRTLIGLTDRARENRLRGDPSIVTTTHEEHRRMKRTLS